MSVPGAELVGPLPAEIKSIVMFTAGVSAQSANQTGSPGVDQAAQEFRGQARDQGQGQRPSIGASSDRILFLAILGGHVRGIRGANRDLREDRHREHQFGLRHLHPHHRDSRHAGVHPRPRPGSSRRLARSADGPTCSWCCQGLATGGSWICYFRALKIGQAAQVAPIDKLSVVLVAIFGVVFLGERLTAPNWLGVALIAAGAVLVAYR